MAARSVSRCKPAPPGIVQYQRFALSDDCVSFLRWLARRHFPDTDQDLQEWATERHEATGAKLRAEDARRIGAELVELLGPTAEQEAYAAEQLEAQP